jgi:hypothetical protein
MHATKLLVPRGGREPPADVMNEIFTFCSDVDLDKPVGECRLYHELSQFVVSRCQRAGNRGDTLKLAFPKPAWDTVGLATVTTDNNKFIVHFKPCKEFLHLESYDSEVTRITYTSRNNFDKRLSTLVIQRQGQNIFEGNVLQMFTQAELMTASDSIKMRIASQISAPSQAGSLPECSAGSRPRPTSSFGSDLSYPSRSNSNLEDSSGLTGNLITPTKSKAASSQELEATTPSAQLGAYASPALDELTPAKDVEPPPLKKDQAAETTLPQAKAAAKKSAAKPKVVAPKVEPNQPTIKESLFKPKKPNAE